MNQSKLIKNSLMAIGLLIILWVIMSYVKVGSENAKVQSNHPEAIVPNMPTSARMSDTPNAISCANGVFMFDNAKMVKFAKNSLERIGEIKLSQGYNTVVGQKSFDVVKNTTGTERILLFQLSKMLVIDTKSCKIIRTITLPAVPSPPMGPPQSGMPRMAGISPYTFIDQSISNNSDIVYLFSGPRIIAVNFESGQTLASQDLLVPGKP